jgi:acetyl esterase/lipase
VRGSGAFLLFFCLALDFALVGAEPSGRVSESQLEALHTQRIEWMKRRANLPAYGVYRDFRAVLTHSPAPRPNLLKAAEEASAQIVFAPERDGSTRPAHGPLLLPLPGAGFPGMEISLSPAATEEEWRKLRGRFRQYPAEALGAEIGPDAGLTAKWDETTAGDDSVGIAYSDAAEDKVDVLAAAFRATSVHILARELTEKDARASLSAGHAYVAHDWLCDPTGFTFAAANNLGVFDMGDTVPTGLLAGQTRLQVFLPVAAKIKLIRDGAVVAQADDSKLAYAVKEEGAYRLEAWLSTGSGRETKDLPWIISNPIYVRGALNLRLPSADTPPNVEARRGIAYTDDAEEKHKLDLYLPKGRTHFPILLFVHGGSWHSGDRSLYAALGNRFAREGIAVAIPSYRLMPDHPHPAQIEDVAAAFAWVYRNAAQIGGDASRIYVSGHSAGGHLAPLLALDGRYLEKYSISSSAIRGVISMSGVYDVTDTPAFLFDGDKRQASPLEFVHSSAPPFLIVYCQWDYWGLPKQARDFEAALKKTFDPAQLLYLPGESHISEIVSAAMDDSPLARAILSFVR